MPNNQSSHTTASPPANPWLISQKWDTILMTGGSTAMILLLFVVLYFRGNRELDWIDLVLAEFHLGATYDAIIRRKLWKTMPWQVLFFPLAIIGATYAIVHFDGWVFLTTIIIYTAVWHRGRQNYGVAAYYQKTMGGPISNLHNTLYRGAVYLPMFAAILFYTSSTPYSHDGFPYYALPISPQIAWFIGGCTLIWVVVYFVYGYLQMKAGKESPVPNAPQIHSGELWVILSHVLVFASAYVFGAWSAGFILILAIHHEFQYLYFTYAIARKRSSDPPKSAKREMTFFLSFLLWPILGFTAAMAQMWADISWLLPLWIGMLLCHYWLDGQIWTRKAFAKSLDK